MLEDIEPKIGPHLYHIVPVGKESFMYMEYINCKTLHDHIVEYEKNVKWIRESLQKIVAGPTFPGYGEFYDAYKINTRLM